MRVLWSIGSLPELAAFDSADRRLLLRRAGGARGTVELLLRSCTLGLIVGLLAWISTRTAAIALSIGIALTLTAYQVRLHRIRRELRATVRRLSDGERLPVCLGCGHDLTGSAGPRCPECGAPIGPDRSGE